MTSSFYHQQVPFNLLIDSATCPSKVHGAEANQDNFVSDPQGGLFLFIRSFVRLWHEQIVIRRVKRRDISNIWHKADRQFSQASKNCFLCSLWALCSLITTILWVTNIDCVTVLSASLMVDVNWCIRTMYLLDIIVQGVKPSHSNLANICEFRLDFLKWIFV